MATQHHLVSRSDALTRCPPFDPTPFLDPAVAPLFFYADGERTVLAQDAQQLIESSPEELAGSEGVRRTGSWVVGALPFDRTQPGRLLCTRSVHTGVAWQPSAPAPQSLEFVAGSYQDADEYQEADEEYGERVRLAKLAIESGRLDKVVLARCRELTLHGQLNWQTALARLRASQPRATAFAMSLDRDRALLGSSPELLVSRKGDLVQCLPLAGSRARRAHPAEDAQVKKELQESNKDQQEHRFLVEQLVERLSSLCRKVDYSEVPRTVETSSMWHLATPISGRLSSSRVDVLGLVLALYPTAAVCGVPHEEAHDMILGTEPFQRGFYAGALGYMDPSGDGKWVVTIRAAEIQTSSSHPGTTTARILSGAGIVAQSDPREEAQETRDKTLTISRILASSMSSSGTLMGEKLDADS